MEQKNKANKSKSLLGVIVGMVFFGISYFAVQQIFFQVPSFDKVMMNAASEINKTCPIMVDRETRLDNVIALPENTLQYNYTLINLTKDQVNIDELKEYIKPAIINNIKTNPDMKAYRENKTTMAYYYKDKNGISLFKLTVTAEDYTN